MENNPANRIKKLMEDLEYQAVLPFAKAANISHTTIQNILDKGAPVTLSTAKKLEIAFDVNPSWLLHNEGKPYNNSTKTIEIKSTMEESREFAEAVVTRLENHFQEELNFLKEQIKEKDLTIRMLLAKWSASTPVYTLFPERNKGLLAKSA